MSEQGVWASMTSECDVWASMGAGAGAVLGGDTVLLADGPAGADVDDGEDLDDDDLDDEDLDDEEDEDDDDDDLDEFDDDELDDDEDDDDEADEIDLTEDRYGRIPGEEDSDV